MTNEFVEIPSRRARDVWPTAGSPHLILIIQTEAALPFAVFKEPALSAVERVEKTNPSSHSDSSDGRFSEDYASAMRAAIGYIN